MTVILVRVSSGSRVCGLAPLKTRITDVFRRSFTVRDRGLLLHFTADRDALHPRSFLVPAEIVAGAAEGDPVEFDEEGIRIGNRAARLEASIPDPVRPIVVRPGLLESNLRRLEFLLAQSGRISSVTRALRGEDSPFRAAADAVARELAAGRLDLTGYLPLFGGGEGLTPAWDDFASGLLLFDRVAEAGRVRTDASFLEAVARRTTAVAAQQVAQAAEGRSSLRFESIACRMGVEPVPAAEFARAIGTGHTSGADILAGLALHGRIHLEIMKEKAA